MTDKPRILIAEPSAIVFEGMAKILGDSGNFGRISRLVSLERVAEYVPSVNPNILVVNAILLSPTSVAALKSLLRKHPSLVLVAFQTQLAEQSLLSDFRKTIDIYTPPSVIVKSLLEMLPQEKPSAKSAKGDGLSKREIEILIHVSKGLMNREIAEKLNISLNTVISHRKNITQKTGIKSVAGLTVYAVLHNFISFS